MKQRIIGIIALTLFSGLIFGQGTEKTTEFVPSGKPLLKIFSNFHNDFSDNGNHPAFEITRAYFGYGYNFSPFFSTKIVLDVADPGVGKLHQTVFLKNALLKYSNNNLTVNFGLIGLYQFSLQESFWSRRYLYKSFQDAYGFGPSADLGVTGAYKINKMIEMDASILNGEGYKNLQSDSTFKTGVGVTLRPVDGLVIRGYFDYMPKYAAQSSFNTFIGYAKDKFSLGVEYNLQNNHNRVNDNDFSGVSAYGSYRLGEKFEAFGRYDYLTSNKLEGSTTGWNVSNDGQLYIAGIEYTPVKGVKIAPNFQGWDPAADGQPFKPSIYLNLQVSF